MRSILVLLALMLLLLVAIAVVGALLPRDHTVRLQARYSRSPEVVWDAITDYRNFPQWRGDVRSVEPLPPRDGRPAWRELTTSGAIPYEVVEARPPLRLVTRIADPNLPFGGTWTYDLVSDSGGCLLTITENGEVYNPVFRFLSRFVIGQTATLSRYLRALGRKFGEFATPQEVR